MGEHTRVLVIGGTGATGRLVVEQALAEGHAVTALVRNPDKLAIAHQQLRLIQGDVLDLQAVDTAVAGQDSVLLLLSQPSLNTPSTVSSDGTQHVVQAMERHGVRRLVSVTMLGMGDSHKNAPFLYKRVFVPLLLKHVAVDKARQEAAIQRSSLEWTIVRPPRLTDEHGSGSYNVITTSAAKVSKLPRADLAAFMLAQVADTHYVRQAVVVGY
ncbi:MAG: SDR family oxidoreductase [Chloroflexales bacterium]|nr:SDR family oxidoreductase [Chloroflexales bacterium]